MTVTGLECFTPCFPPALPVAVRGVSQRLQPLRRCRERGRNDRRERWVEQQM